MIAIFGASTRRTTKHAGRLVPKIVGLVAKGLSCRTFKAEHAGDSLRIT
jgi:hypothetical protein